MDALLMIHQKILTPMLPKINVLPVQWSALIGGVVFLFCSFPPLLAQVTLGGEVKAVNEQFIPFANVLLLQPQDSTMVSGVINLK